MIFDFFTAPTGSGALVLATSPTLVTPVLGTAAGTALTLTPSAAIGLTLTGATETASFPLISGTQTWNNSGVTFTGIKLNVTNTASAAGSRLIDVQLAGVSQLAVTTAGRLEVAGGILSGTGYTMSNAGSAITWTGRSELKSSADGNILMLNNAETGFSLLQFGGTTSSFPAWKRSSAVLEARLADDSTGAVVKAGGYQSSDGSAGVTAGPYTTITSITIKNGLVTAITGA